MSQTDRKGIFERIYGIVKQIPYGRVATYGVIARLAGNSRMEIGRAHV